MFEGSGGPIATRYAASTSRFAGSAGQPSLTEVESVGSPRRPTTAGPASSARTSAGASRRSRGVLQWSRLAQPGGPGRVQLFDAVYVKGAQIANTDGEFSGFGFFGPSLNDRNQVAFQATLDDFFSNGAFTGPNATRDAVVRTGTVTYDDGTQAVIRATPRR